MNNSKEIIMRVVITAALLAVLGFRLIDAKMKGSKPPPAVLPGALPGAQGFDIDSALKEAKAAFNKAPSEKVTTERVRDPFQVPDEVIKLQEKKKDEVAAKPGTATDLKLEGVIWGNNNNLAIISGKVLGKGGIIEGARVVSIDDKGVVLIKDGAEIKLKR